MKSRIFISAIGILLINISCQEELPTEPKLLFKSGFASDVYIDNITYENNQDYRFILSLAIKQNKPMIFL